MNTKRILLIAVTIILLILQYKSVQYFELQSPTIHIPSDEYYEPGFSNWESKGAYLHVQFEHFMNNGPVESTFVNHRILVLIISVIFTIWIVFLGNHLYKQNLPRKYTAKFSLLSLLFYFIYPFAVMLYPLFLLNNLTTYNGNSLFNLKAVFLSQRDFIGTLHTFDWVGTLIVIVQAILVGYIATLLHTIWKDRKNRISNLTN